mmetsp:Transcript_44939/g.83881  ORF Transcript_44939/g.83881 Transcript_44939/m.83881 type:complete len:121 (+) Transcript_44939:43-405(+)
MAVPAQEAPEAIAANALQLTPEIAKRLLGEVLKKMQEDLQKGRSPGPSRLALLRGCGFTGLAEFQACVVDVQIHSDDAYLTSLVRLYQELTSASESDPEPPLVDPQLRRGLMAPKLGKSS